MKVLLPDSSELELPDGATGLDAAAAIGPKLAEQAILVRSNGQLQDLRLPLEDGQPIQILTTRDTDDPDALYVVWGGGNDLRNDNSTGNVTGTAIRAAALASRPASPCKTCKTTCAVAKATCDRSR